MHRPLLVAVLLLCTACTKTGLSKPPESTARSVPGEVVVDRASGPAEQAAQAFTPGAVKPLQNPELVSSIERFLASKSPEARQQMFAALNQGVYLLPLQRQREGGNQYASFQLPGVGQCMPVFTDFSEAVAAGLRGQQLQEIQAADLWRLLELSQLDCVLVNPGSRPLPLRRHIVEKIRAS